jgi:hypothetical protein
LTVGSTVGSIRDLFAKVKAIDAKHGKFDLLICVGDFFGPARDVQVSEENDDISQLLDGRLEGMLMSCTTYSILIRRQAPIECYVMQGECPLPTVVIEKFAKTGGELCKNVFLMSMFMEPYLLIVGMTFRASRQIWNYYNCKWTSNSMSWWYF